MTTTEEMSDDLSWANQIKIDCRQLETRKSHRTKAEVFERLGRLISEAKQNDLLIASVAVFANIVVEDDEEEYPALLNVFKYGILERVVSLGNKILEEKNTEDTFLLRVVATSLSNFSMQLNIRPVFVFGGKDKEDEKDREIRERAENIVQNTSRIENSPIPFSLKLLLEDSIPFEIRKISIQILIKLSDFSVLKLQILNNDLFLKVIERMRTFYASEDVDEQQGLLELFAAVFSNIKNISDVNQLVLEKLTPLRSKIVKYCLSDEVRNSVNGNLSLKLLTVSKLFFASSNTELNLLSFLNKLGKIISFPFDSNEKLLHLTKCSLNEIQVLKKDLLPILQLLESMVADGTVQTNAVSNAKLLLKCEVDLCLGKICCVCSFVIENELNDAVQRKKTNDKADINREKVMEYAFLRKYALSILAQLANSEENCISLVQNLLKQPEYLGIFEENSLFGSENMLQVLWHLVDTMSNFDVEGTQSTLSLFKNLFFCARVTNQVIQGLRKYEPIGNFILKKKLYENQDVNIATFTVGICRLVISQPDLIGKDAIISFFGKNFLKEVVNVASSESMKMHPVVRAEMGRCIALLLKQSECTALQEVVGIDDENGFVVLVSKFFTFILQSRYSVLLKEGLEGLQVVLKKVSSNRREEVRKCLAFFPKGNEEIEIGKEGRKNKDFYKDIEQLMTGLDNLDLTLTDEDLDISKAESKNGTRESSNSTNKEVILQEKVIEEEVDEPQSDEDLSSLTLFERILQLKFGLVPVNETEGSEAPDSTEIEDLAAQVYESLI
eukprot:snap_masked-scaffold_31-processed-gene-0.3-mRNA-1 protein AED:1.00 eAED:1.00 QI:0/0/0/0/1/1/2/0/783